MVRLLLSSIDVEIQAMVRKGSIDMRLQNLQKRQTNIRRIASELARKRMVAMMQHVASQSLRSSANPNMTQELPALDWQRHDPAEKAFYHAIQLNLDRFKKEIDWQGMQQGILGEIAGAAPAHAPGTMQLDAYVGQGGISSQPPPDLAFEDPLPPLEHTNDEEERWVEDSPWVDEEAFLLADLANQTQPSTPVEQAPRGEGGSKHGAAMELAPSTKVSEPIQDEPPGELTEQSVPADDEPGTSNVRIRILETLGEPILDEAGEAMTLEAGDVHMIDQATAEWLVEAGVAERAAL